MYIKPYIKNTIINLIKYYYSRDLYQVKLGVQYFMNYIV